MIHDGVYENAGRLSRWFHLTVIFCRGVLSPIPNSNLSARECPSSRRPTINLSRNTILVSALLAPITLASVIVATGVFTVSSSGYRQGGRLPVKYTCDGAGSSPALNFKNVPVGTKSFAILGWDDNTSAAPLSTWEVYDIPITATGIPEGVPSGSSVQGFKQGVNSFGRSGFSAPCPAKDGKRREYYIDFYAINVSSLDLPAGAKASQIHAAIKKHKIAESKLLGVYSRK